MTEGTLKEKLREACRFSNRVSFLDALKRIEEANLDVIFGWLEDAKQELGVDLEAVVKSFKGSAVSPEVRRLVETFSKWFGAKES